MERNVSTNVKSPRLKEALASVREANSELAKEMEIFDQLNCVVHAIFETRIKRGLSQRDLAEISGIKQPMIDRIERLECCPRIDSVAKLLIALDLQIKVEPRKKKERAHLTSNAGDNQEVLFK